METGTMTTGAAPQIQTPAGKQHFAILDGLRGIAAIVVVIFHFMEIVYSDYSKNFAGHGFLAVDFFFCLSGFVIAYAYDDRMPQLRLRDFFRSRLIRLHPLVALGAVLGLLTFLFDPLMGPPAGYGFGKITMLFITTLLLVPYPVMPERFFNLFCMNAPAWSLWWEYIANIFYALVLWRLRRHLLLVLGFIAAVILTVVAYKAGNLMGGWSKDTFWQGGARLLYSFTAGMLVYRFRLIIPNRLGFPGVTLLLLLGLFMPYFPHNWLVELVIVLFYFPALVALGAGARLAPWLEKPCTFSGKISYPLYMTHYGFMWIFAHYLEVYKPAMSTLAIVIPAGVIALMMLGWIAMVGYDQPLRNYLSRIWKK
ncbi:acyltransferase family protein [Chitinophaga varians]|uniref:acyltransferase family protein n=1 Tax=Chitinophaga varians TaxID=2202339 RepID=UPI001FE804D5|nr:acyltransferase [Chitinophaga varians]